MERLKTANTIQVHDKRFKPFILNEEIVSSVKQIADKINHDYADKPTPLFVGVLNGAFMFMGELMKHITLDCEISFVKIASYAGTESTGNIKELIGLNTTAENRDVIIVEDIVDTGVSIEHTTELLKKMNPASVAVCTLLFKPESYTKTIPIDYCVFSIPDRFVIGFGLDYDGLGRNYKDIYEIDE